MRKQLLAVLVFASIDLRICGFCIKRSIWDWAAMTGLGAITYAVLWGSEVIAQVVENGNIGTKPLRPVLCVKNSSCGFGRSKTSKTRLRSGRTRLRTFMPAI